MKSRSETFKDKETAMKHKMEFEVTMDTSDIMKDINGYYFFIY